MLVRASLPTLLILGALSLTGTAQAFDRTCTARQDPQADRCVASVTVPETVVYGTLSDHGAAVGDRYDWQGNPIDRQGNVVAAPTGRSGSTREVFVQEPAFRR
ncbi:hypothetical protein SAMN02990966_01506 [Rhodospirillales bacterium URHD0017]|nr:hypothetical protein SAMN02990966_01506 [Rhodospirillales bacterium URHD0017]